VITEPPKLLIKYWQEHFNFNYSSIERIDCSIYLDELSQGDRFDKLITLFPFDHLKTEKHSIDPDTHYRLLSKVTLASLGVQCPKYSSYNLHNLSLEDIELPKQFPYLIKTSHGLSGEGTYIIKSASDLNYCLQELRTYLDTKLLETIVVSEFISNVVQNYCVQFYISKRGGITLIGVTSQLVTEQGNYLGGLIHYRKTDISKFLEMIAAIGHYAHKHGYFGVIGFDVLENQDGQLYVIDVNFRVNGSTPLCLQRHTLLKEGKEVAKYYSDYRMSGTLDSILVSLKSELDNKDFMILSAQELVKYGKIYTEMYGIVTGETIDQMQHIEQKLQNKGLELKH
jgi:hypothetical protein